MLIQYTYVTCAQAVLETFVGVGFMLGPTIGGLLYSTPLPPALEWVKQTTN